MSFFILEAQEKISYVLDGADGARGYKSLNKIIVKH
jgi:hypothetical protein